MDYQRIFADAIERLHAEGRYRVFIDILRNKGSFPNARCFAGQKAYTRQEAKQHFLDAAKVASKPFIYLSAGVSNAEFTESLELAAESGVRFSGVLCGRATWKDGIPIFAKQGADAFRQWLESEGVKNIANVNDHLMPARPWFEFYGAKSADELK